MNQDSMTLRVQDLLHRIRRAVAGSQSTIDPPFGDSPNLPDIYYVDSGNGADGNDGRDPGFPMATIDAAINRCTASQGDVILVQPGHAETLTAQISLDVIGVSIIGLGEGTLRPQLTINAVIDGIDIGAANCRVENIGFAASTAGATSQINVDAANATIKGVHFEIGASDILGTITVTASGELPTVEECTVVVTANGCDEWILFEGVVERPILQGNTVLCGGATNVFDEAIIQFNAVACTNVIIRRNTFVGGGGVVPAVVATALVPPNTNFGPGNAYLSGVGGVDSDGGFPRGVEVADITFATGTTGSVATHKVFTVTGLVKVNLYNRVITGPSGAGGDIEYGVAATAALFIASTAGELLDTGELWYDATPTTQLDAIATALPTLMTHVLNGQDIGYAIGTDETTDGRVQFVCQWEALSPDASVVAEDGTATI